MRGLLTYLVPIMQKNNIVYYKYNITQCHCQQVYLFGVHVRIVGKMNRSAKKITPCIRYITQISMNKGNCLFCHS